MLLEHLVDLISNLFEKLLEQSITQDEYKKRLQEALQEYDASIRSLGKVIQKESLAVEDGFIAREKTDSISSPTDSTDLAERPKTQEKSHKKVIPLT